MRRQPLPVGGALDGHLVASVGQTVQGAVAQDGIVKRPCYSSTVRLLVIGYEEAGNPVAADDQLVGSKDC